MGRSWVRAWDFLLFAFLLLAFLGFFFLDFLEDFLVGSESESLDSDEESPDDSSELSILRRFFLDD